MLEYVIVTNVDGDEYKTSTVEERINAYAKKGYKVISLSPVFCENSSEYYIKIFALMVKDE